MPWEVEASILGLMVPAVYPEAFTPQRTSFCLRTDDDCGKGSPIWAINCSNGNWYASTRENLDQYIEDA
jgi:hypothetical protein